MRIGTIAQHSNVGPTGPGNSIIPNTVPGRLNDLNIFAWFDFTDPVAINGGSTNNIPTSSISVLQQCDDKGPGDGAAFIDQSLTNASDKGPEWNVDGGQNNHSFLECVEVGVGGADYLRFKNPRTVTDGRKLGFVLIYDLNNLPPTWLGNSSFNFEDKEQTYFRINGDNSSFVELVQKPTGGTLFRFVLRWSYNGSTVASHVLNSSRVQSTSTVSVGGDSNENFAFVGSTGLNPTPVEILNWLGFADFHFQVAGEYFRGNIDKPPPLAPNDSGPTTNSLRTVTGNLTSALPGCPGASCAENNPSVFQQQFQISKDGESMLFSETHGNGAYSVTNEGLNAKIYELIIFEDDLLDGSQFHSISEYIRNKYNISYTFGSS